MIADISNMTSTSSDMMAIRNELMANSSAMMANNVMDSRLDDHHQGHSTEVARPCSRDS